MASEIDERHVEYRNHQVVEIVRVYRLESSCNLQDMRDSLK
jgi:hypothetical protein